MVVVVIVVVDLSSSLVSVVVVGGGVGGGGVGVMLCCVLDRVAETHKSVGFMDLVSKVAQLARDLSEVVAIKICVSDSICKSQMIIGGDS